MFLKVSFTILQIFCIVNGSQKNNENTSFDIFNESQDPISTILEGARHTARNQSYYSLIAPGLLKANRRYTAVVSLHSATEPCFVDISITGSMFNATVNVLLQPFKSKTIDFYPPNLNYGLYTLRAEGVKGCSFSQEKLLVVDIESGPKIYIQTDKAIYKPEDLVQFRVLFLNEHTKPLNINEPVQVDILDATENIVKTFKDVRFTKGLFTNSLKISDNPIIGVWTIRVTISGMYFYSRSKTIEVKKYVLPKFSVHIKTPKHVVTRDAFMKALIYGKYTFGKYVQGVATVQLWDKFNKKMWQEKNINVKTMAGVEFSLANIDDFTREEYFNLVVSLKENFTGIIQKESLQVMLHNQRYEIIANDEDFEFRGFEPYRLQVHVQHWNGAAVLDRNTPVKLIHGEKSYESYMNDSSVASFEFENQPNSGYLIYFKDSNFYLPNVYQSRKENTNPVYYCKLKLIEKRLRLGAPAKILVSSSEDIPFLIYTIVGHGNIIRMQQINLPQKQKSYTIHIKPTIEMIPTSYIHVYYSHNGIFRYNELELSFPKEFENKIFLKAPKETKPGQKITLEVNAEPQSIVGILAVDLGVHLLDPSYDLQRDSIMKDLAEDKSYIYSHYIENGEFMLSGLVLLTNIKRELFEIQPKKPIRQSDEGPLRYRTQFPEVWIFQNVQVNSTNTKVSYTLPDSITTWRLTAFSLNEKSGLGIVDGPTDITAIKPFFISLNLPYSVKWGEIVAIPVLVFNYHSQSLDSIIVMRNDDHEYEFMESPQSTTQKCKNQQRRRFKSSIEANGGHMFTFYIQPSKVGHINLRITASNELFADAIDQQLKVESEGVSRNLNQAVYLNSNNDSSTASTLLEVRSPSNAEPSATEIQLSVGGDYIVPTLDNLQNLVEMPTGCGEQNMVHFAPNILILQYLKTTGAYSKEKELVATIKSYTDIGYQQQLSYRHNNGGYSVFGQSIDEEASTWLTAYTVRFFIKASKFASIERRIIETGLEYLSKAQSDNGSFPYTGYLFDPAQQNQYGLTAFILATFLEDRANASRYQHVIDNGLQFLTKNLDNVDDAYALSIIAFVFQIANNLNVNRVVEKLLVYRKEENGLVWYSGENSFSENNVEITAYIFMALLDSSSTSDQMPILKWLLKQRNYKGGFLSTQDTVVGLQALTKFNQKAAEEKNVSLEIKYTAKDKQGDEVKKGEFKIQAGNLMATQKQELPTATHNVSIEMSGAGSALLQLSHHYKLLDAATPVSPMISPCPKPRKKYDVDGAMSNDVIYFIIKPKANILKNNDLDLEICFTYTTKTNMVIMEVNLPSGYRTDDITLEDVKNYPFVKRIEPKKDYTTIIIYLDKLQINVENCINVGAYKTNDIFHHKSVAVIMYDYYNTKSHNMKFYNIEK